MTPFVTDEDPKQFETRKADHIRIALDPRSQSSRDSGLDSIRLIHDALPEINFADVNASAFLFSDIKTATPMFVSSMTAGHSGSGALNLLMARACEDRNWAMGVGSQRKQLSDGDADREWVEIRKQCRRVPLFGNIGLAQLIRTPVGAIRRLADTLQATAMIVHTNPLQECLQPEGTPQFAGGLQALEALSKEIEIPVILKETGCGFSERTLRRLLGTGIAVVDISGLGGTHWGRVEGGRSKPGSILQHTAETFADWGIGTVESLQAALALRPDYQVWASGGVRSGLDAAKLVALGAEMVGLAKPIIEAALVSEEVLAQRMETLEFEFKTAMFCSGNKTVAELRESSSWDILR